MNINFITKQELDRPIDSIPINDLISNYPFFNDYYIILYIKESTKLNKYIPTIVSGDLQNIFYANNLGLKINNIINMGDFIHSHVYKISYKIVTLVNNMWCIYIEKRYIWDLFESIGIITIMGYDKVSVLKYFEENMLILFKKKVRGISQKPVTILSKST
jgi:hypothetical protein